MSAGENQIVTYNPNDVVSEDAIRMMIVPVRGVQVMLDRDLAALYGVEVKYLNRQVKRNIERFPSDFMFQRVRVKAPMLVNSGQTLLYWDIGHDILEKQDSEGWGTKVVRRMSADKSRSRNWTRAKSAASKSRRLQWVQE